MCDSLHCDIHFIAVIWNQTHHIFNMCLFLVSPNWFHLPAPTPLKDLNLQFEKRSVMNTVFYWFPQVIFVPLFIFFSNFVILSLDEVGALYDVVQSLSHVQLFCDPMVCSPPSSSAHGLPQARILEWVATSFSRRSSWPRDQTHVFCIAGGFFTTEPPGKPSIIWQKNFIVSNEFLSWMKILLCIGFQSMLRCNPRSTEFESSEGLFKAECQAIPYWCFTRGFHNISDADLCFLYLSRVTDMKHL